MVRQREIKMTGAEHMEKKRNGIVTAGFVLFLLISLAAGKCWQEYGEVGRGIVSDALSQVSANHALVMEDTLTPGEANATLMDKLPFSQALIDLCGSLLKSAGIRTYFNKEYGVNITESGYCVGYYLSTTTDFEAEQTAAFSEYLEEKGIQLLYVNEPAKYIDDDFFLNEFGKESWLNRNADKFLSRIDEAGINYIDIRDAVRDSGKDPLSFFFRTDHHWTVPTAKMTAGLIAEELNEHYGYHIDMSLYDEEAYHTETYENAWIGEQGRLMARTYTGLEDYTMMEPEYPTHFIIHGGEEDIEGDFGIFINKDQYTSTSRPEDQSSWHYSYRGFAYPGRVIENLNATEGKVLVLGDSYEASLIPFLSLGVRELTVIFPRDYRGTSIRDFIEAGDYDTVIIAYAQSMIGSHDAKSNFLYYTFDFS